MLQELSQMDRITQLQDEIQKILVIMSSSIEYLTTRNTFKQVADNIPVAADPRPTSRYDPPDVFAAHQKELVNDLVVKAKQIELLIDSLPEPEAEEVQAKRLQMLENEMSMANEEYIMAVSRAKDLHLQISEVLRAMLDEDDTDLLGEAQEK